MTGAAREAVEWPACPLCGAHGVADFTVLRGRRYRQCSTCRLIHLAPAQRPGPAAEKDEYLRHQNDPADPGYRAFLDRLCAPLAAELAPGAEGLDYGCGPVPTLSVMLEERGFPMQVYDPFFADDPAVLARHYDFVTSTETLEHFHHPGRELARLNRLVRPGGWLAVMTEVYDDARAFDTWRYTRESTHVCFYRAETMTWIAERFGWAMQIPHPNVRLFRTSRGPDE